jgi:hypothetical protein
MAKTQTIKPDTKTAPLSFIEQLGELSQQQEQAILVLVKNGQLLKLANASKLYQKDRSLIGELSPKASDSTLAKTSSSVKGESQVQRHEVSTAHLSLAQREALRAAELFVAKYQAVTGEQEKRQKAIAKANKR